MGQKRTVYTGGVPVVTDTRTLAETQTQRLAYLAAWAVQVENGGHNSTLGVPVKTDDRAKTLLHAAYTVASGGSQTSFNFKDAAGVYHVVTAAQIIALFADVVGFVQAVGAQEAALAAQINAATTNDAVDAIDFTAGWPS